MKVTPRFKRKPPKIFLKEWRESFNYTQEDVVDRLATIANFTMSVATLSRLENSETPAQTHQLAALAEVFDTSIAALVSRPPRVDTALREVLAEIHDDDHAAVMAMINAFQAERRRVS